MRNGAQPQYWDGAAPPPPPPQELKPTRATATAWGVVLIAWTAALTLVSSGWLTLPAKDSDLQAVSASITLLRTEVAHVAGDVRALAASVQGNREDIIRLLTVIDERRKKGKSPSFRTTLE